MMYSDDTKASLFAVFFAVLSLINGIFSRYTQILWITLCVNCYIGCLTAVFITVLSDCTKSLQLCIILIINELNLSIGIAR